MKRAWYWIRALTEYALVLAAVWYGAIQGVAWLGNVLRFYVWSMGALMWGTAIMVMLAVASEKWTDIPEMPKPLPSWLSWPIRVTTALGLAAAGWFFTASGYIGLIFGAAILRITVEGARKKTTAPQPEPAMTP